MIPVKTVDFHPGLPYIRNASIDSGACQIVQYYLQTLRFKGCPTLRAMPALGPSRIIFLSGRKRPLAIDI
jgi:hypothetical protein